MALPDKFLLYVIKNGCCEKTENEYQQETKTYYFFHNNTFNREGTKIGN